MARILVTDGEQRSSLAAVRSLGRAGHHVLVASVVTRPLAGASRHCGGTVVLPDPASDAGAFVDSVARAVDEHRIRVLLPTTDASASLLLALRASNPELVIPFPNADVYREVSDKRLLTRVASDLGLPVPPQMVLADASWDRRTVEDWTAQQGLPVVLKPARSVVRTDRGVLKLGVVIAGSVDELKTNLEALPDEAYPILLQRRIQGPGLGAFLLTHAGRTVAAFGHRRLREKPPTGGVSVYREGVELRDDVRAHAERLLHHFRWSGVAMVEFKEDAATGTPYLMEINGRLWGSLQLAVDSGVDFPEMLVRVFLDEHIDPVSGYRVGLRSRWLWGDVDHLLARLRAPIGDGAVFSNLPSRPSAVGRFLIPWRPGDRFEVLRFGDPSPFIRESLQWLRHVLSRSWTRAR